MAATPRIDTEKCTGCGDCAALCPAHAVGIENGRAAVVRPEDCDYCTQCETFCCAGVIRCPFEIVVARPGAPAPGP